MTTKKFEDLTPEDKFSLLNSAAVKIYLKNLKESGLSEEEFNKTLKKGAGKGLEPKPWCSCHNRNPCPIFLEIMR